MFFNPFRRILNFIKREFVYSEEHKAQNLEVMRKMSIFGIIVLFIWMNGDTPDRVNLDQNMSAYCENVYEKYYNEATNMMFMMAGWSGLPEPEGLTDLEKA